MTALYVAVMLYGRPKGSHRIEYVRLHIEAGEAGEAGDGGEVLKCTSKFEKAGLFDDNEFRRLYSRAIQLHGVRDVLALSPDIVKNILDNPIDGDSWDEFYMTPSELSY